MKKAILTLFSAAALVSCDKIGTTKEPTIPATQKTFWQNTVQQVRDSGDLKPQALAALEKSSIVVKKELNEDKQSTAGYAKLGAYGYFTTNKNDTVAFFHYTKTTSGASIDETTQILFNNTANDSLKNWSVSAYKFNESEHAPKWSKGTDKTKSQYMRRW